MVQLIDVNEFKQNMIRYIYGTEPVAVSRNDRIIGYFIPVPDNGHIKSELESLRATTPKMETLLSELGLTEEQVIQEFSQRHHLAIKDPENSSR